MFSLKTPCFYIFAKPWFHLLTPYPCPMVLYSAPTLPRVSLYEKAFSSPPSPEEIPSRSLAACAPNQRGTGMVSLVECNFSGHLGAQLQQKNMPRSETSKPPNTQDGYSRVSYNTVLPAMYKSHDPRLLKNKLKRVKCVQRAEPAM